MKTYETIQVEHAGFTATVTLNRPTRLNALNLLMVSELTEVFSTFERSDIIERPRAVVLTGGDRAFAAGADITELCELNPTQARAFSDAGHALGRVMEEASFPVIAAVEGFALGGGCELALCCDIIYASEKASFGLPEATLGLIPGFGGTQRLARRVGLGPARELIYTADRIDAARALEIGLVDRVFMPSGLSTAASACAARIAAKAPLAIASAKRVLNRGFDADLRVANELEATTFATLFATEDAREGLKAFLQKRDSEIKGR
jgi:enoyl-CoA hydratase